MCSVRAPTCKRRSAFDANWVRYQLKQPRGGAWVGSAVMLSSDEMADVRGVIVDVVFNRSTCEITHAIVAIDLGQDFPMVYQPIRLSMLRPADERGLLFVQGSSDALVETLPSFMKYETNVVRSDRRIRAPFPRSTRTH